MRLCSKTMRTGLPLPAREVALPLLLAGGYLLLAKAGLALSHDVEDGQTLWLAGAAALTAVLIFGRRVVAGIFIGATLACATSDDTLLVACLEAVGNTAEPLLGAWLLRKVPDFDPRLHKVRDVVMLALLAGLGSPLLGAAVGTAAHLVGGEIAAHEFGTEMLLRWAYTAMGIVSVTPLLLIWTLNRPPTHHGRWLERSCLLAATLAGGTVVFGDVLGLGVRAPHEQWMLVFVIWAALRFGRHSVAMLLLVILAQALYFSSHQAGPFYEQGGAHWLAVALFNQVFLAVIGLSVTTAYTQRREAESRLLDQHALLRRLIDSIPDLIFFKDRNGVYLGCNAGCQRFFGVPPAQVVGLTDDDFYPLDEARGYRESDRRAMEGTSPLVYEESVAYRDGTTSTIETLKTPLLGANGEVLGVIGISRDIAARKAAQHERDLMQRVLTSSVNEIMIFDAQTHRFRYANERALHNLGYTLDELQLLTPREIKADHDDRRPDEVLLPLLAGEMKAVTLPSLHRRKDGSTYEVETLLELCGTDDERYFLATCLDVTEKADMRRRLRDSERHFQILMENVSDVIWEADLDWNYLYMSPSIEKLRGYTVEEVMREPMVERYTPASLEKVLAIRDRLVASNGREVPDPYEIEVRHKDGRMVWVEVSISPIYDAQGRVRAIGAVSRDIARRKQAEEALSRLNAELEQRIAKEIETSRAKDLQLQQQERLAQMGEMIGIIAHQWRQPLNALGIVMADLEDAHAHGECDDAYFHGAMARVHAINRRLSNTIDEFRGFYRKQDRRAMFDLVVATRECVKLVEPMLEHAHIDVHFHGAPSVAILGRAGDFSQVMLGLVGNARDAIAAAGRTHGRIEFTVADGPDDAVVIVADNGAGIPADVLPHIFEPYFTTKPEGSGIGLFMSKMIVEKSLGGTISVTSEAGWTRFAVRLRKNVDIKEANHESLQA